MGTHDYRRGKSIKKSPSFEEYEKLEDIVTPEVENAIKEFYKTHKLDEQQDNKFCTVGSKKTSSYV